MKRRAGFVNAEFPIVILTLGVLMLYWADIAHRRGGNIAWFFGIVGGAFAILGGTLLLLLFWPSGRKKD